MNWNSLLAPVTERDFVEHSWNEQRPLHVRGGSGKFAGLFSVERFVHAIRNVPVNRSIHLKAVYTDAKETSVDHGCLGAEEALAHFDKGATLCATAIELADPALAAFRDQLRAEWLSLDTLYVNCYYSPDGQGFGTHFDPQSVWVLQIDGRKRWRFSSTPAARFPVLGANHASGAEPPALDTLACVDLEPGDLLFLPPGTWHRAEALGGPSLALSLTQPHDGLLRLVTQTLTARLQQHESWRMPAPRATDTESIDAWLQQCLAQLQTTVAAMTATELRDLLVARVLRPARRVGEPAPRVDENDVVRLSSDPPLLFSDATTYHAGRKYTLPAECHAMLTDLRTRGPLTAADAASALGASSFDDARELLLDLIQLGILETEVTA
jgi:ribosomal protein L16 Arg81 hydroxylase